jgi:hypothetical protein
VLVDIAQNHIIQGTQIKNELKAFAKVHVLIHRLICFEDHPKKPLSKKAKANFSLESVIPRTRISMYYRDLEKGKQL